MSKPNPEAVLAVKLYHQIGVLQGPPMANINRVCTDAAKLMSLARSLRRMDHLQAARYFTPSIIRRRMEITKAAMDIGASYGLKVSRSDNLQCALRIYFPNEPEAGWGI